ncbi:MAG: MMPL family transporter [Nannocystaceae bacterium]|nr:MMPL family transporter [Nannocystaceae bacterium]
MVTLLVTLLVALVAGQYARGIRVNTNLEALLADNASSVEALAELRDRQGPTDLLNIAVRSEDPVANRKLVEDILARVSSWPEVRDAFIDLDYTPLRDHALYYLDHEELVDLRDRLRLERQHAIAGSMSLTGTKVDPSKLMGSEDWDQDFDDEDDDDDDDDDDDGEPDTAAPGSDDKASLGTLLQEQRERIASTGRIRESDLDLIWPKEDANGEVIWEDEVRKPVASQDGTVMLVRARLIEPPTNLKFSSAVTTKVEALLETLQVQQYAPDMLAKVGGAYGSSSEAKSILVDLRSATWLSAGLVITVLLVGFRSARSLVIVLAPLATSVVVTVAIARLVLGELNVLTAFLFAVLLGIGVDFAVHLYAQRERLGGVADWTAVFTQHLRPLGASMLTTMGSFLVLTLADFRGFQEFGLIAAIGVFVAFVAAIVMVPALDVLIGPSKASRAASGSEVRGSGGKLRAPILRIAILVSVGLLGLVGAPRVQFEQDMRNLRSPKTKGEKGIGYQRALKATQETGTPVVLLADSSEQLDAAVDVLETRKDTEILSGTDRSWIRSVYSLATQMPAEQASKVSLLDEIGEAASRLRSGKADQQYLSHLKALERLALARPLGEDELPGWAKQLFRERNGEVGNIGLLYTQVQGYDLEQVVHVTRRFAELMEPSGVRGASTRFILGDLTIAVQDDTQRLPPYALAVIALLIALDLRRLVPSLITFATLCLGLLLTFGVMGLWPIRINFYNLVVMPAVVGLGIDASIHLWHARKSAAVGATSKAALISALTTAGGFSGLIISQHGGLRSIGLLGVTATLCCVLVAIAVLGWPRASK